MVPNGTTELNAGDRLTIVGLLECVEESCQMLSG
jgi:Trk K+ transport system NAD-binding subunit